MSAFILHESQMSKPVFSDHARPGVRRNRKSFFFYQLFLLIVSAVLQMAAAAAEDGGSMAAVTIFGVLLFAAALAGIVASVQRLHDVDKSGWWLLLSLVPLVNIVLLVYLYVAPGTRGPNRFGPDPLEGPHTNRLRPAA